LTYFTVLIAWITLIGRPTRGVTVEEAHAQIDLQTCDGVCAGGQYDDDWRSCRGRGIARIRRLRAAIDTSALTENVQLYVFGGRNYCWYDWGWNGPGWYWCGYGARRGFGWGGGYGYRGWGGGRRGGGRVFVNGRGGGGGVIGGGGGGGGLRFVGGGAGRGGVG